MQHKSYKRLVSIRKTNVRVYYIFAPVFIERVNFVYVKPQHNGDNDNIKFIGIVYNSKFTLSRGVPCVNPGLFSPDCIHQQ